MRIEARGDGFVIVKGTMRESYFDFYVDSEGSCWSMKPERAHIFTSSDGAQEALKELKLREQREAVAKRVKGR